MGADICSHVGTTGDGYDVHYGHGETNLEAVRLLQTAQLFLVNTGFEKRDELSDT